MSDLLGIDEFRAAAREGEDRVAGRTVVRLATAEPMPMSEDTRTIRFVFSDGSVDRAGDTINQSGWQLTGFLRNPVAMWAHDSYSPPIGKASNVFVDGGRLMGDISFASADLYPLADTVYRLVKAGFINATSVGFMPMEWAFSVDKARPLGIDFKKQELVEISVVPVPANANSLIAARANGINTAPVREWASKLLDGGEQVLVQRADLETIWRAAKMPTFTIAKNAAEWIAKDAADWKVGAARDLPLGDDGTWDGPAAAARMLDAAGFNGDNPDSAAARRGFLIYDSGNPTLKGSYKLPFADLVGGSLKAMPAGIRAAASRLPQTDAPQPVLDSAKAVIAQYEDKMKPAGAKAAGDELNTEDMPLPDQSSAPIGTCGRAVDATCGMKNEAECAIHAPTQPAQVGRSVKAGRTISAKNEADLRNAVDLINGVLNQVSAPSPDDGKPPPPPAAGEKTADDDAVVRARRAKAIQRRVRFHLTG